MLAISKKKWGLFLALSFLSIWTWQKFTAPQLSFIDLSVGRQEALKIACNYLTQEIGLSPRELTSYNHATIFNTRDAADRYLQKSLGFKNELAFFKKFNFEIFLWDVRFFKENQKQEYSFSISAATGQIISYTHTIDASAFRPSQSEDTAREKAINFLKKKFNFNPQYYTPQETTSQKQEKRTDYSFSWEHNDSKVRWSDDEKDGWAVISTGATVSGDEILGFYKNYLKIPDAYLRHLESNQSVGWNIGTIFRILFYIILTSCIYHVIVHRNNIIMHSVKNFCVALTALVFGLYLLSYCNNFENVLYHYPTTQPIVWYLWRNITLTVMNMFIAVLAVLMPALAGASLHQEVFPKNKQGSFLYYIRTTFFSRHVTQTILIGTLSAIIMIGIQSASFEIGQRYFGVWIEYSWMTQLSASSWPALGAFILAATASLSEEICFRYFGINIAKKFFKNTFLACLIASIVWGYGHSGYLVFPMWFRSMEVTVLGLFLSYVYLRFGILAVITAHYLFDCFWETAAYLLGKSQPAQFYGSLAVLLLPLFFAAIAYIVNKKVKEQPLRWKLNVHQLFNLQILKEYLERHRLLDSKPAQELKHEIASHGWDLAVVEMAIEDLEKKKD